MDTKDKRRYEMLDKIVMNAKKNLENLIGKKIYFKNFVE